jgi:hypothetical protein
MIDFKTLRIVTNSRYSFVGIQKEDDSLCFYLPKGFEQKSYGFSDKQDLFFLLYRVLNTFKGICIEKGYLSEHSVKDRDGVIKSDRGSSIQNEEESTENVFYSKLDIIGKLLDAYDEPRILALAYRLGITDKFDISQIHKNLHQAVFLPNNAAYVNQMTLPKRVIQFESTDIVTMYCHLFCEVKIKLKEIVSAESTSLAERFRQKYLGSEDSLFDEQTYEQVLDILKDVLESIDHNTPIKDVDYWEYYEAIKLFLYGDLNQAEDGEIWGISNFNSVWESMCLTYLVQTTDSSLILHMDGEYLSSITKSSNIFQINESPLNPDAVIFNSITNKMKIDKIFKLRGISHNDYGFRTLIDGVDEVQSVRLGCIGQQGHIIETLSRIFKVENRSVIIGKRLSGKFYSFWDITDINLDSLVRMCYFNHFFYLALERNIFDWEEFNEKILKPLNVDFCLRTRTSLNNVFAYSLLRDYCMICYDEPDEMGEVKKSKLIHQFNRFISNIPDEFKNYYEIIDVKYSAAAYFHNPNNIEEIKKRSVRKQFVYEHLLQKHLENREDKFSDSKIQTSFWLPSDRPNDPNLLQDTDKPFMDNYIHLKNVNFSILAENYIASAKPYI